MSAPLPGPVPGEGKRSPEQPAAKTAAARTIEISSNTLFFTF